jgi:hypothetical protein
MNESSNDFAAMFNGTTGGATERRIKNLKQVIANHPNENIRIEECADERTGCRYGGAKIRSGKCIKIGGGGRNRGQKWAYQVWAVWN